MDNREEDKSDLEINGKQQSSLPLRIGMEEKMECGRDVNEDFDLERKEDIGILSEDYPKEMDYLLKGGGKELLL